MLLHLEQMSCVHMGWNISLNFKANICSFFTERLLSDLTIVLLLCETEDETLLLTQLSYTLIQARFSPLLLETFISRNRFFCVKEQTFPLFPAKECGSDTSTIHMLQQSYYSKYCPNPGQITHKSLSKIQKTESWVKVETSQQFSEPSKVMLWISIPTRGKWSRSDSSKSNYSATGRKYNLKVWR